ncbi:MAG: imidazoleglycerol-phosphate dehydratase HisB [Ruminococcaceae bacterium]|nr:imidazoleglycerol-phosphate dehydratase HisB [Oscillospiraceae bacterium]
MLRTTSTERNTLETKISLSLNIDGTGKSNIDTGCGFLNHMLTLFCKHGCFDMELFCQGDVEVDDHHTVEDIGIVMGKAFSEALSDKRGITRYGDIILPMDEALVLCAIDVSGRSYLGYSLKVPCQKVGNFDTELVKEFYAAFVNNFPISLHLTQLAGENSHHIIEAGFKAFARALKKALAIDLDSPDSLPTTKGVL